MTTYIWKSWSGGKRKIEADRVTFEPGHVVFWRKPPPGDMGLILVLAVVNTDVQELQVLDLHFEEVI
jgi:hypothetical protein